MNDYIRTALALIAKGNKVFPCWPGAKEPLTSHGYKDATAEPTAIHRWWEQYPNANLAIATGVVSGVVVLDVDFDPVKGKDGAAALAVLERKHGPLPVTLTTRTPRGGQHFYFRHPGPGVRIRCSTGSLGNGLDVRADGGYVLVPPSRTEPGEYRWESSHVPAELPAWLLEMMTGSQRRATNQASDDATSFESNTDEENRIREALAHIPPSLPHDDWVRILMALHNWHSDRGKVLARDWSSKCAEKFHERDFEAAWVSFKPGGGITLGTLFEMARRYGWRQGAPKTKQEGASHRGDDEFAEFVMSKWPEPPRREAFYGIIGEFVRRLEPHTESDPMAVLVQLIVGFGNVVGRNVHFEVEADKHYCNLNAAVVGNSSKARKGTSWGHVVRILRRVDSSWPRYVTGLSTGEGLISCVRDPTTKTDKEGNLVDAGVTDKRLLAVESEFGRTLQCSNREGNTLSAVIRQAFDNGNLRVAVKGAPQVATAAHISVIGHITGIELNQLLTKSDTANGFANRFLWVAVRRSKLLPEGGNVATIDMSDIVERLSRACEFAKTAGCISKDDEAVELWRDIYAQLSQERPGLLGAVISRAEALVLRIAMIFAVTDCSPKIRPVHLRAALAIWDYCEASAAFIFGASLGNPLAERLLQALQEAGEQGLGLTEIHRLCSGHATDEEIRGALTCLHSQGLAQFVKVKTSGRPRQVWFATKMPREKREPVAKKPTEPEPPSPTPSEDLSSLKSLNSLRVAWEVVV